MRVHRIQPHEGERLRTVRLRALAGAPEAFGSTLAEALALPAEAWTRRARECADSPRTALFFAEYEGATVGLAGGYFEAGDPVPSLISMWVEPPVRGRGGGEALVEAVVAWAREAGAAALQLWVTETNAPAVALYTRLGFTDTGDRQPLPSNPALRERRMVRAL